MSAAPIPYEYIPRGIYDYDTPEGYGDTVFLYAFRPSVDGGLASNNNYGNLSIQVTDGDFVARAWSGLDSVLKNTGVVSGRGAVQLYDQLTRSRFKSQPGQTQGSIIPGQFPSGQSIWPEIKYLSRAGIRFDLFNTQLATNTSGMNVVPVDQMVFYGVRRNKGAVHDPGPSSYSYYEKAFQIQYPKTEDIVAGSAPVLIQGNGTAAGPGNPVRFQVPVADFDFELRRIEAFKITAGVYSQLSASSPEFAITLYDRTLRARMNEPINSNRICHYLLSTANPLNFWPCPGLLYPVNSLIQFDILSLIPSGGTIPTVVLNFVGVRRIRC